MTPDARKDIDALLHSLKKAEQFQRWGMFREILNYILQAGARFIYLGKGEYGVALPPFVPQETKRGT